MNLEQLRACSQQIKAVAAANRAGNVRVFGSVARGDSSEKSDVDLLVTLAPDASLFDIAGLHAELSELLHCDVDVIPDESIDPIIASSVLRDAVPL